MIWLSNEQLSPPDGFSLVNHVQSVIEENCAGLPELDSLQVRELAEAVSAYALRSNHSGMYVESGYLVMLASQALFSIGERQAAHRVLVFGTGLVHPSEWIIRGDESVWTIDLGRMTLRDATALELAFFNSLNIIINCLAQVWDASDGQGTLGLRHLADAASGILQRGERAKIAAFATETCRVCRAKLEQLGQRRGWHHVPGLLLVDPVK